VSERRHELAFVVQRYGEGITGGSESLARAVAERLVGDYRITVFTSCARDYVSWRNELPAGLERLGGVDVRRYKVEHERDLEAFNAFAESLYDRELPDNGPENGQNVGAGPARRTPADEHEFLRLQGPEVPSLVEALRAERDRFAAFVFFPYLYYPTYWGLKAVPERSALVPTTHDEPPLRFSIYRELFSLPRAFGFLTPAEAALVRRRFDLAGRPSVLAGMGVAVPARPDVAGFRARYALERPYAIYAGRIDAGKGCAEMLAHHERYRRERADGLELLLIGRLAMPEPRRDGVRYLGFLPEPDKAAALAGARAVVCPSPYESLSIALLEGFALSTPGLVNARSDVLKEHCLRSGAGLFYEDGEEYAEALDLVARDAPLREALGASGRRYVEAEYRWDVVLERWRELIRAAAGARI
jgi:glycosyltransferase involved in cell wall biosynthesis